MSDSVDSGEVKAIVSSDLSSHLAVSVVVGGLPCLRPVQVVDPLPGSPAGHSAVSVSAVEEDLHLVLQLLVDPVASFLTHGVVEHIVVSAGRPAAQIVRNVHCFSHRLHVHVVGEIVSEGVVSSVSQDFLHPGSVFVHGKAHFVVFSLSIDVGEGISLISYQRLSRTETSSISFPVEIVPVDPSSNRPFIIDIIPKSFARINIYISWEDIIEVDFAFVCLPGIPGSFRNHGETSKKLGVTGQTVYVVVGGSVSDHETSKVDSLVFGNLHVSIVDSICQVGDIDSSIGLSSDINFIALEFREFLKPSFDSNIVISSRLVIVGVKITRLASNRVANSSRCFNIDNISSHVPRPRVFLEIGFAVVDDVGPVLGEVGEH